MTVFERIKYLREKQGMSQQDLALKVGYRDKSAISKVERGDREINQSMIVKYAEALGVSPTYLMFGENSDFDSVQYEETASHTIRIPVLGKVAAGIPIEAIEEILDYEELSPDMARDGSEYFALQIKGSSMEPKISDGDVVIVRKQPDVDSGQIAIVCVNGDEATCKKIMKQDTGILLLPLNPTFAPTFYSNEDIERIPITILGRVVELRAKF